MTRNVLLTGAGGRIARAFLRRNTGNDNVICVGRRRGDTVTHIVDICEERDVEALFRSTRPDTVVHMAAVAGEQSSSDPEYAHRVNVHGTEVIVNAASRYGVGRIVFLSTAAVYGDRQRRPSSETDTIRTKGVYAETKRAAELLIEESGIDFLALRVFNVYGPGMSNSLVNRLLGGGESVVRLTGLDRFVRDYVHVDDVADAVAKSVQKEDSGFTAINIGSGVGRSNRDLLSSLGALVVARCEIGEEVDSFSCADVSMARTVLDWEPRVSWPGAV